MTYIITEPCVGTKDVSCADVCPVDCIHPAPGEEHHEESTILYIDPAECIDCDVQTPRWPRMTFPSSGRSSRRSTGVYFEEGHEAGEKMVADYLASKGLGGAAGAARRRGRGAGPRPAASPSHETRQMR